MEYEVLSPWADVDPMPLKGNSPRVTDLRDKTIGFFTNIIDIAPATAMEIERQLKMRFPTVKFSHFHYPKHVKEVVNDPEYKDSFERWVKGIDTVVTCYGG